eukprot:jgi/Orpsp1_1/1188736/evm.model.d7180000066868.1
MELNSYQIIFKIFCKINGIIHLLSTPYTPQQNGRIEKLNGVLINSATAMLEDAKLSKKFWQDAVSTASYLYNITPHKPINNKIPYKTMLNKPINYQRLKIFGCKSVFFNSKEFSTKISNINGIKNKDYLNISNSNQNYQLSNFNTDYSINKNTFNTPNTNNNIDSTNISIPTYNNNNHNPNIYNLMNQKHIIKPNSTIDNHNDNKTDPVTNNNLKPEINTNNTISYINIENESIENNN